MTTEQSCCFRDCDHPAVAFTRWGPICYEHSFRLAEGAQCWYNEAASLRKELTDKRLDQARSKVLHLLTRAVLWGSISILAMNALLITLLVMLRRMIQTMQHFI